MKTILICCLLISSNLCLAGVSAFSDSDNSTDPTVKKDNRMLVTKLVEGIDSTDPSKYANAVDTLFAIAVSARDNEIFKDAKLRQVAIPRLVRDLEQIEWGKVEDPEYAVALIEVLGEFRDERAIPGMMKSIGWVGGLYDSFAKIGPAILVPLNEKITDENDKARNAAIWSLGRILVKMDKYGHKLSEEHKRETKRVLKEALRDSSNQTCEMAVVTLHRIADIYDYSDYEDIVPQLETIAKKNTFLRYRRDEEGRIIKEYYPIREQAGELLKKIEEKKKEITESRKSGKAKPKRPTKHPE